MAENINNYISIGGRKFDAEVKEMKVDSLLFYTKNPRVYSVLNAAGEVEPDQDTIYKYMKGTDHVKTLRLSIKTNGGIHTPIVVYGNTVLEGNSRLAAYKLLREQDPVTWGLVPCRVILSPLSEDDIFNLLISNHINARKDWSPIEQGGYLYRRTKESRRPIEDIASRAGIVLSEAKRLVGTYELMIKNNDTIPDKWSFYEELWKSSIIKKRDDEEPEMQLYPIILQKIKENEIPKASDIRTITKAVKTTDADTQEVLDAFLQGTATIDDLATVTEEKGNSQKAIDLLKKIRTLICSSDFKEMMKNDEIQFLIKRINKKTEELLKL